MRSRVLLLLALSAVLVAHAARVDPGWTTPRSCTRNDQCSALEVCSDDGTCISMVGGNPQIDAQTEPRGAMPVAYAVLLAVFLGFVACGLVFFYGGYGANIPWTQTNEFTSQQRDNSMVVIGASFVMLIIVSVMVGFAVGFTRQRHETSTSLAVGATACGYRYASACAPYLCQLEAGRCTTQCMIDSDCTATHQCDDGVCTTKATRKTEPINGGAAFMIAAFAGLVCCACCTLANMRRTAGNSPLLIGFALGGLVTLIVGLSVGLSGYEVNPNAGNLGSTIPGVVRPYTPIYGVVLAAVLTAICCCFIAGSITVRVLDGFYTREKNFEWANFGVAMCVCALVALLIGASTGLNSVYYSDTVGAAKVPSSGNSTTCDSNLPCAPYVCDTVSRLCRSSCRDKDDGLCSPGYECQEDDTCAKPTGSAISRHVVYGGAAIGIALASGLCAVIICIPVMLCVFDDSDERESGVVMLIIVFLVVTPIVGLPLGLVQRGVPVESSVANTTCATLTATSCEPFLCNVQLNKCMSKCSYDEQCAASASCQNGLCRANPSYTEPFKPALPGWATGTILVGGSLVIFTCLFLCFMRISIGRELRFGTPIQDFFNVMDNNDEKSFFSCAGAFATVLVCALIAGLVLTALPTGKVDSCANGQGCSAGYVCTADNVCVVARLPTGTVAVIAVIIGLIGAAFCLGCSYASEAACSDKVEVSPPLLVCCMICVFAGVAAAAGAGLGLREQPKAPLGDNVLGANLILPIPDDTIMANSTSCYIALSGRCAPYLCDLSTASCRVTCTTDNDCGWGTVCSSNRCADKMERAILTSPFQSIVVTGTVVGAGLLFLCCCVRLNRGRCSAGSLTFGMGPGPVFFTLCGGFYVLVSIAIIVGVPVSYATSPLSVRNGGATAAVCQRLESLACAPYFCDVDAQRCGVACGTDRECVDGYYCDLSTNKCQEGDSPDVGNGILAITITPFALLFCAMVTPRYFKFVSDQRQERLRQKRVREEAEAAALSAQLSQLKRDHPVYIDVIPAGAQGIDPTMPSPAVWALDPKYNPNPFERALDAAMRPGPGPIVTTTPQFVQPMPNNAIELPTYHAAVNDNGYDDMGIPVIGSNGLVVPVTPMPVQPQPQPQPQLTVVVPPNTGNSGNPSAGNRSGKRPNLAVAVPVGGAAAEPAADPGIQPLDPRLVPITRNPQPNTNSKDGLVKIKHTEDTCSICMSDDATVRFVGRACAHGYCDNCARYSLQGMMDEGQFPARCPGCRAEDQGRNENPRSFIPADTIERLARRAVLTLEFCRRFINMMILQAFEPKEVISCPVCTMLNSSPDLSRKEASKGRDPFRVECAECQSAFCAKCNVLYHGHQGMSCEDFSKKQKILDEEQMTAAFISKNSRKCPQCGMGITHYRGHACHHIRPGTGCPNCGKHFCYVCLGDYPDGCNHINHDLFCDDRCGCPICPDCRPGRACPHCDGHCPSCQGQNPDQQ